MKLSKVNIQFIDRYLLKSDILFIDIRMELVDHIASDIEVKMQNEKLSFYDAFKIYMVENKRDLVKNYENQKKKNQLKGFGMVWKNFKKPWSVITFLIILVLLQNFNKWFGNDFPHIIFMWSLLIIIAIIYIIFSYPFKQNRFSNLEALGWVMFVISYIIQMLFNFGKAIPLLYEQMPLIIELFMTGLICFCLAWMATFFKQRKEYKSKFKKV